jgi:hypothetical protein
MHEKRLDENKREKLTAMTRVLIASITAILLLIALPSLWNASSIVASKLILTTFIFCNENKKSFSTSINLNYTKEEDKSDQICRFMTPRNPIDLGT